MATTVDAQGPELQPGAAAAATVGAVKIYGEGDTSVRALDDVTVGFETGKFTAIMGPSGSGKSTLLHCTAGLDTLTEGKAFIGDTDLSTLDDTELTILRRERVGFVFQAFNLVPTLTAEENVTLPLALAGHKGDKDWIREVTDRLGLAHRLRHRPNEMSGGEVLRFMRQAVDDLDQSIVMVTHDPGAASHADRIVFVADGRIVDEMHAPTAERVLDRMKRFGD